jgi:hypothetical protein
MIFEESRMIFDFSATSWSYLMQYDKETDFDKIKNAISGTKAVDFIGVLHQNTLCIIEVKNFRGSRIENKPRVENGDDSLDLEVALKVRDTCAGIVGAAKNSTHRQDFWQTYLSFFQRDEKRVEVILWLEEDKDPRPVSIQEKRKKSQGGTLNQNLKKRLKWLTPYVFVNSIAENNLSNALNVAFMQEV